MKKIDQFSQAIIEQKLKKAQEKLQEFQAQKAYFQINDWAETVGRCYRLLGDEHHARECFKLAAETNLKDLADFLAENKENQKDLDARWSYLFESLWLFYLSGEIEKTKEILSCLTALLKKWPEHVPLLQRFEMTLASYVAGKIKDAKKWYQHFNLSRYEKTPHYPEVKLLKAGLKNNQEAAHLAIKVTKKAIADNQIKPWYCNNYEYDFLLMAEKLLQGEKNSPKL